jgi:hypothetical protein
MLHEVKGTLLPCPSCFRHVRLDSPACPFCAGPLPDAFHREGPVLVRRKTRFAGYSHTAATAALLAATGCGDLAASGADASLGSSPDGGGVDVVVAEDGSPPPRDATRSDVGVLVDAAPPGSDGSLQPDAGLTADANDDTSVTMEIDAGPCDSGPYHAIDAEACLAARCSWGGGCSLFECRVQCPPPPPYGGVPPLRGEDGGEDD